LCRKDFSWPVESDPDFPIRDVVIESVTFQRSRIAKLGSADQLPLLARQLRRTFDECLNLPIRVPESEKGTAKLGLSRSEAAILDIIHKIDQAVEVVVARRQDRCLEICLGLCHQPETHLRDDAEVRLGKYPVDHGAEAQLVLCSGFGRGQCPHASAQDLAVCQDDLHPTMSIKMGAKP
jgi:hypothetical protein